MVPPNGDETPALFAFRGAIDLLFDSGDLVRRHHGAWEDRASGKLVRENRQRWITKTQRPKRIALHSKGSRRAVAVAHLAAQGRRLSFRVVWRERIIRALCR